MTQPELELHALLEDVVDSAAAIEEYVRGYTFEQYEADRRTRVAVERELITIGEALRTALRIEPALEEKIAQARVVADFQPTVWAVIHEHLPRLLAEVRSYLGRT